MHHLAKTPPRNSSFRRVVDDVLAVAIALTILLTAIARPSQPVATLAANDDTPRRDPAVP